MRGVQILAWSVIIVFNFRLSRVDAPQRGSDERVPRSGGRVVPRLFFAGRFDSKAYETQLWIAWQARATRMTVMSREWIQHLHVRLSEIVRVSGDDDEIVNERGRCDQTVLDRHRFTGFA